MMIISDGKLVVNRVKENAPDVLLLDEDMSPDVSVLKSIREDRGLDRLKVVMLFHGNQHNAIGKSLDLGIDRYVIKTETDARELVDIINKILH